MSELRKPPTVRDVAKLAGVSTATVSRALNKRGGVDDQLVQRVNSAAGELGYRMNSVARNLRRAKTTTIAVIIPDISNPFYTHLVHAVQQVAWEEHHSVVLCNTDADVVKETEYILNAVSDKVAGVIVVLASESLNTLDPLRAAGVPLVVVDRVMEGLAIDSVVTSNVDGAREATTHLIENGYRRIACIAGPLTALTSKERYEGYRFALADAGIPFEPRLLKETNFMPDGGFVGMTELLADPEPPDAVFIVNNMLTIGALEAISDGDVRVPDDIALVGFDSIPWARLIRPTLSVVEQPVTEMGMAAGRLLLQRVRDPLKPVERIVLPSRLVPGGSSRRRGGVAAAVGRPQRRPR